MLRRSVLGSALAGALWLCAAGARAEGSDPAAAEQLFLAGRAAMQAGDLEMACQRFAESQRLDPAAGTLINLAECLERRGLIASSWQRWKEALDGLRKDDERREQVASRMSRLEARMPRLELKLSASAPATSVVTRDGLTLGAASLGLPLPIDPGAHQVRVTAEGHAPRDYAVTFAEGEKRTLEVEPGAKVVAAGPALAQPSPSGTAQPDVAPKAGAHTDSSGVRTVGWIAAGAGAVALGVGGVFGALALGKKGTVRDECHDSGGVLLCSQAGLDAASSGHTFATISNVGFGVGIAGLALGGTLLLVTKPISAETALRVRSTPSGGSVSLEGRF